MPAWDVRPRPYFACSVPFCTGRVNITCRRHHIEGSIATSWNGRALESLYSAEYCASSRWNRHLNDYTMSLIRAELDTLETRREELTKRFFQTQCAVRDVVHPLSATGQAWRIRHRHTASWSCKNIRTSKIPEVSKFFHTVMFKSMSRPLFSYVPKFVDFSVHNFAFLHVH